MPIISTPRGQLRPNSGKSFKAITASGGITSDISWNGVSYRVHKFLNNGTFTVSDLGSGDPIELVMVGGGGSGGVDNGSGGGAGGLIDKLLIPSTTSYSLVIGAGGQSRPGPADDGPGYSGFNTTGFGLTALGGAGGTGWSNAGTPIGGSNPGTVNGGSGAGQSTSGPRTGSLNSQGRGTATQPGSASGGYGNNGGFATPGFSGGGGGAGGPGGDGIYYSGSDGKAGDGGEGYFLNGRFGSGIGVNDYLAGGGAGGFDYVQGLRSATVFTRNGTTKKLTETGEDSGPANTGSGGNGANHDNENSGAGSSGIILIRYRLS